MDAIAQSLLDDFSSLDGNGDGLLSFEEARAGVAGLTELQFGEFDLGDDGVVSDQELESYLGISHGCYRDALSNFERAVTDFILIILAALALAFWPRTGLKSESE